MRFRTQSREISVKTNLTINGHCMPIRDDYCPHLEDNNNANWGAGWEIADKIIYQTKQ